MLFRLTNRLLCILLLPVVVAITGCGGGGNDDGDANDGPPVSQATVTQITETWTSLQEALSQAMNQIETAGRASAKSQNVQPRQSDMNFTCQEGGNVSMTANSTVTDTSMTFDASLTFEGCDGIDGSLTLNGDGTITEDQFDFQLTLNGAIDTPTCDLTMKSFRQTMSFSQATDEFTLSIDGSIEGGCEEENFRCSFDDYDVDLSSQDAQSSGFEESCYQT